jgi:hypothetical protein
MSWDLIHKQLSRELKREPNCEEVQTRMLEEAFDENSFYHPTTEGERK